MKAIDLNPDGWHTSHWGLTDFYDDAETRLVELLNSGENFEAYGSSKKEIASFQIVKTDGGIDCTASASMDEGWDLINDALWEVAPEKIDQPEEFYESINEMMIDDWEFSSNASYTVWIHRDATLNEVKAAIDEAWEHADKILEQSYLSVKNYVLFQLDLEENRQGETLWTEQIT